VRVAEASSRQSPLPVIRDRFTVPAPAPAPSTQETSLILTLLEPQTASAPSRSPMPTPRNVHNRTTASPDIRRRTESPVRPMTVGLSPQTQSDRTHAEFSPTALLLHKLFRNRDPSFLPERSDVAPRTPTSTRASSSSRPSTHQHRDEVIYTEIPSLNADRDDDSGSEYLSIDNLSLTLNLENVRTDCVTPPPPYRSIFDDEK
jgi:hypothetical protein